MDIDRTTIIAGQVPEELRQAFGDIGFKLLRSLGDGGMAQVYLAEDADLGRQVAIKIMRDDLAASDEFTARFVEEAQRVASFQHNNILTVFRAGAIGDLHYIVMQLAPAGDLADRIEKAPLEPDEAAHVCACIADALAYAHAHGIVHRDLKPANVFFSKDGDPILADFGIAKSLVDTGRTHAGMVIGTPKYMSPEQSHGQPIDEKTDVYSLGLVFFETLTGKLPTNKHANARLRRELPPGARKFADVILACLQEDPTRRPTAAECARLIGRAQRPGGRFRNVYLSVVALVVLSVAAWFYLSNERTQGYNVRFDIEPKDAKVYVNGNAISGASAHLPAETAQITVIKRGYYGQLAEVDPTTTQELRIVLTLMNTPTAGEKVLFQRRFDDENATVDLATTNGLIDPVYVHLIELKRAKLEGRDIGLETARLATLAGLGDDASSLKLFLAATVRPPLVDVDLDVARSWVASASNGDDTYHGYGLASHYRAIEIMQARGARDFTQLDRETARDLFARAYAQGLDWPDHNMAWYVTMACGVPINEVQPIPPSALECVKKMPRVLESCKPELSASKDAAIFLACLQKAMAAI